MRASVLGIFLLATFSATSALAQLTYPPSLATDAGASANALAHAGYLDVTLYGADPTGKNDSTTAIQNAIDDANKYAMVTYVPFGTYLVSGALTGEQTYALSGCQSATHWGTHAVWQAPTLVGPASGPRPTIQLKDGSTGFQDASNPVAVIHFFNDGPGGSGSPAWSADGACQMFTVIRDLNVVLGKNPGAIGIEEPGTQGCYLENVNVDANGGYAGIQGVPSLSELAVNLEVDGGQYGIIPYWPTTLVGVTVKNQSVAGLKLDNFNTLAVVGFDIEEPSGVAAIVNTLYASQRSQVALTDGTITISGAATSAAAIQNANGHDLYIDNVFVKTAGPLIQNGTAIIAPSAATSLIAEYAFTNNTVDTNGGNGESTLSKTLIDGVLGNSEIKSIASATSVPSDLVLRHLPGQLPAFDDPGVVDVTTMGADPTQTNDSTAAIQKAIDAADEVFLPRGQYVISATIVLKSSTKLFGMPGSYSQLVASPSWDPAGKYVPFVQTADDANARTYVGDLFLEMPNHSLAQTYLYGVDWRAGRSSIARQVYPRLPYAACTGADCFVEAPRDIVKIEGNGGGRFYGLQLSQIDNQSMDASMRELLVDHTKNALTLYAPNPEHSPGPMVELNGASNVRILGTKVEGTYGLVQNSSNVFVTAYSGHNTAGAGSSEWVVANSTNVAIAASSDFAGGLGSDTPGYLIFQTDDAGIDAGIRDNDNVSLYREGTIDMSPFPFCGDKICDGAETPVNCPADCIDAGTSEDGGSIDGSTVIFSDGGTSNANGDNSDGSSSGCACNASTRAEDGIWQAALIAIAIGSRSIRRRKKK